MVTETDLDLADGRTLHVYDTGGDGRLAVFWHHGTPNIGAPPEPLFGEADRLGIRWVSYDRPGYGALMPERVLGVVAGSSLAPFGAYGLDYFAGMAESNAAELRAASEGHASLENYLETAEFDPESFTPADHAALTGEWSWLLDVVGPALEAGPGGMIDDELAYVTPWGFEPARVISPVLFLHGGSDRVVPVFHGEWLARRCPSAELWLRPDDGHISVLGSGAAAMGWLREHVDVD